MKFNFKDFLHNVMRYVNVGNKNRNGKLKFEEDYFDLILFSKLSIFFFKTYIVLSLSMISFLLFACIHPSVTDDIIEMTVIISLTALNALSLLAFLTLLILRSICVE